VGFSKKTRTDEVHLAEHALTAVKAAVEDSGLKLTDIDGLATFPELRGGGGRIPLVDGVSHVSVNCMLAMLKLPNPRWHIQGETVNIGGAFQQAANAILAGVCNYAVIWRAMHNRRAPYYGLTRENAAGPRQFSEPYGFSGPGGMSIAYMRYLELYGQQREKMATLAVTQRKHANKNPNAHFYKTPLTVEEYLDSRMISHPFCLYDCDIPVQAAYAMVLTTAERARDLKPKPAYLAGYGQRMVYNGEGMIDSLEDWMAGTKSSAPLTWEKSGLGPKDVDVAQIYDGFSSSVIYGLEGYGFCGEGETLDFIQDGRIELDGELPLNTFGGSLSDGRMHGIGHLVEGVLQATGRAGERQVKNVEVSFVGASMTQATTFVFVPNPY